MHAAGDLEIDPDLLGVPRRRDVAGVCTVVDEGLAKDGAAGPPGETRDEFAVLGHPVAFVVANWGSIGEARAETEAGVLHRLPEADPSARTSRYRGR